MEFTADLVRLSSNSRKEIMIKWSEIIYVNQMKNGELEIVSKSIHEGEFSFKNFSVQDDNFPLRFFSGLVKE